MTSTQFPPTMLKRVARCVQSTPNSLTLYSLPSTRFNFSTTTTQLIGSKMYEGKTFASTSNTPNGEVSSATKFNYHQRDKIVWADYSGGSIVKGSLIAKVLDDKGELDMRYHHINQDNELMTGQCRSVPEILPDGRIRLHETWKWTSGDESSGTSVIEEVQQ